MNDMPTLTLAISTISDNIQNFICNFNFNPCLQADEVIIVIQGKIIKSHLDQLNKKFITVLDDGLGLSRSRNIAIKYSNSDFIWFMDDDVILNDNAIAMVKKEISNHSADIFTVRTKIINSEKPYKKYPGNLKLLRQDIIGISSVEIIASLNFILNTQIRFNELLGLGTKYPSCEENIFLLDLYDSGARFIHLSEFVQDHPKIDIHNGFKHGNTLFAKGVFCKRYGGLMAYFLIIYWILRSLRYGASIKDSLNVVYGYKSGYAILK